jgi:hypothetical protein
MAGVSSRHIEPLLQGGGNVVVNVDTPGLITWAGATDITLITDNITITVTVPGAITWTGSTNITVIAARDPGSFIFRKSTGGSTFRSGDTFRFVEAAGSVTITVDTPGAITFTGQTVGLKTSIAPTAGAITWTGQAVGLKYSVAATPGAVLWGGSTVTLVRTITPIAGGITWAGGTTLHKMVVVISAGQITWTGSEVTASGIPPIFLDDFDSTVSSLNGDSSTSGMEADSVVTSLGS